MTDKVQKIREWVKARLGENTSKQSLPQFYGMMEEDERFLDFLDSLQEEPVSVWHDMSEEAENGRNIIIIDPKNFYGAVLRKGGSQLKNHNKERYVKWAYIDDIVNITNKEEPVSEDLEEASLRASIIRGQYIPKEYLDEYPYDAYAQSMFKRGAKWQEEQMMAKAVDGEVTYGKSLAIPSLGWVLDKEELDFGDKVKLIIIKED